MGARADVIVLGAGIVGVSVALHLQKRGRDVVLIDRREPGEETSYGNAGLIQREAGIPYTFPRAFGVILSYAINYPREAVSHPEPAINLTTSHPVRRAVLRFTLPAPRG